jgi:molecular chaperone HtpG
MTEGKLSVNSENILPIIKKWLYSDKDIFLRELVSNSCDAINKLKLLQAQGVASKDISSSYRIDVAIDKENSVITITDNGIGMTKDEVEKYIAQIAFSGAEEFLSNYKSSDESDQIIGHFGLGFYSSYMVSSHVTIESLSYQDNASSIIWSCDGSSTYTLKEGEKKNVGTTITLNICEDSKEFLEEEKLKEILSKYCPFLPYDIFLNDVSLNNKKPLWMKSPNECTDKEYLEFYRELYPLEPEPIFWIHLNVDYPFHLKGILYFPKFHNNFDVNKSSIKLFCNRVFVSDNCKDLLPDYLSVLRGALDSPDIPLNVSRSYLQMDKTVRQLGGHIAKKISDKLSLIYNSEREKFISSWQDIEMIIKLAILQDDKFYERSKNFLIFKSSNDEWMTIDEYLTHQKGKDAEDKIFYIQQENSSLPLLNIFKSKGMEVLLLNSHLDSAIINFLEGKIDGKAKFQRIDGAIDDNIIDKSREQSLVDAEGRSMASKTADFIRKSLSITDLEVEAKSLDDDTLPGFIMIKEEERRMRDFMQLHKNMMSPMPTKKTLIINTNSKLIQNAEKISLNDPKLSSLLIQNIYNLLLLSQKEFDTKDLTDFITTNTTLLEELSSQ